MSRSLNSKARWRHTKRMFDRIVSSDHRDARRVPAEWTVDEIDTAYYEARSLAMQLTTVELRGEA